MFRPLRLRSCVLFAVTAGLLAQPVLAQDVQYRTVTKLDMGGVANAVLKLAGASEIVETTYIKGARMRSDIDKTSTIFDLEKGLYIVLNHDQKTYTSVPIGEITRLAAAMATQTQLQAADGRATATAQDSTGKADFTFDLKVEPTGERQKIAGMDAERALVTMETDMKYTPEGETQAQDAGKLVMLMDVWEAKDGPPQQAVAAFQTAAADEVVQQAFGGRKNLGAAFSGDPKMAAAMEKAAEEARKLAGMEVRTTVYLVGVAPGIAFDRDLVLKPQPKGGEGAKRALGGALRGALGAKPQEESRQQEQAQQAVIAKLVTEVRDVQTKSLAASLFEPPSNYRQVSIETGGN